eukprot:5222064-Pleurochrysis_carterae.AAC.1
MRESSTTKRRALAENLSARAALIRLCACSLARAWPCACPLRVAVRTTAHVTVILSDQCMTPKRQTRLIHLRRRFAEAAFKSIRRGMRGLDCRTSTIKFVEDLQLYSRSADK